MTIITLQPKARSRRSAVAGHEGTKARRDSAPGARPGFTASLASSPNRQSSIVDLQARQRAFSLIEVLLAIFILGIGVISIAALFPAGIAQQRQSNDDIIGPIVADNALSILRGKLTPDDFGTFEEFGIATGVIPLNTVPGDWPWLRPAFILEDDPATETAPPAPYSPDVLDDSGTIDIFSAHAFHDTGIDTATEFPDHYPVGAGTFLFGIPFNKMKYRNLAPAIFIAQNERYYPQISKKYSAPGDTDRPQYVWDCMFRRFQGKILVAIFVYRVTVPGGGAASAYVVGSNQNHAYVPIVPDKPNPPLPIMLWVRTPQPYCDNGPWKPTGTDFADSFDDAIVLGVEAGLPYDPDNHEHAWQEPRQWLIDQNNNIHRVLGQYRADATDPMEVELVRPAPAYPPVGVFFFNQLPSGEQETVSNLWYIPLSTTDANGRTLNLTPVYATVKEL